MRWDDARYFLASLTDGSFADAARSLGVEQSTVSRRIGALEEALSAELFVRTPQGLVPTELALRLRVHAEQLQASVRAMEAEAKNERDSLAGSVRVAMTDALATLIFMPALKPLLLANPQLRVEVVTGFEIVSLLRREADLALRFAPPSAQELVSLKLVELDHRLMAHRSYLERIGPVRSLDQLEFIGLDQKMAWMPEYQWYERNIKQQPRVRTNSFLSQIAAVRAGLGAALMASALSKFEPELVPVPNGMPAGPKLPLYLVAHRAVRGLPRINVLWERLIEMSKELNP